MTAAGDLVADLTARGWRVVLADSGPALRPREKGTPPPPAALVDRLKAERAAVVAWLRAGGRHCGACRREVTAELAPLLAGPAWGVYCGAAGCPEKDRHQQGD